MKTTRNHIVVAGISAASLLLAGCASLPNDGANPKQTHLKNLHATRYAEIFIIGGNALTKDLRANCYNTSYLNGFTTANKDSAPQAIAEKLDNKQLKKENHALGAFLNGPKLWMLDWVNVPFGVERNFDGLKARWCGLLHIKGTTKPNQPYVPTTIERKTAFGFNKGTQVFLIDDSSGNTWIMKGYEVGLHPKWTFAKFSHNPASFFKKLPAGWKYRTKILDKDLILIPATGVATIMPDEHFNVYDKTGPGYSSYKP